MVPTAKPHAGSGWSPSVSASHACIRGTTTASMCSPVSRWGRSVRRLAIASRGTSQTPDVPDDTAARLSRVRSRIVRQTSLVTVAYLAATAVLTALWGRARPLVAGDRHRARRLVRRPDVAAAPHAAGAAVVGDARLAPARAPPDPLQRSAGAGDRRRRLAIDSGGERGQGAAVPGAAEYLPEPTTERRRAVGVPAASTTWRTCCSSQASLPTGT